MSQTLLITFSLGSQLEPLSTIREMPLTYPCELGCYKPTNKKAPGVFASEANRQRHYALLHGHQDPGGC
jgi:hypothetical protein